MRNNTHTKFILTPILSILKESIIACRGIGIGIETQTLSEYVMQTIFLKMTGALEQKMKCICWEIASNDYEYRYQYLKKNYGECSSYEDKNHVYKDLIEAILKINKNFNYETLFADCDINTYIGEIIKQKITSVITIQADKKGRNLTKDEIDKLTKGLIKSYAKGYDEKILIRRSLLCKVNNSIIQLIDKSPIATWEQHNFQFYKSNWNDIYDDGILTKESLFSSRMHDYYTNIVYKHRNRCAHNLTSYQENLPTLATIISDTYKYENYFFRVSIIILIDEIFIRLFNKYKAELINDII